ncbi:MAG TPA: PAS domain-containing protein [Actinomycetota bacterium]|nr:PAS domain-containing protein [Actinomycetota bacterium]
MSATSPGSELRRLRALVADLDGVVWEADASTGRLTFVSQRSTDLLGYAPEAFLQAPTFWADHIHPDDRERAVAGYLAGLGEARTHDMEYRFLRPDGSVVWVRDIGHTVTDVSGAPLVVRGLMVDVTERRYDMERRDEIERRYQTLVEQTPAVTYIDDLETERKLYISPQVELLLGYSPAEFTRDEPLWPCILHPDDRDRMLRRSHQADRTSGSSGEEYRMIAKDGRVVWVHDEAVLIRDEDGLPSYWQGVWLDVTERRRAEDLERQLEIERGQAAELRALDEMKNTFLQAVSHDLRTPLAGILGLAVTLERQYPEADDVRDMAGRIAANARKLDRMVTDLLDLDRISRGIVEPNVEPTDVGELVARVADESGFLSGRSVTYDIAETPVEVDPAKVERIVENLLANAVRHTPPDARIWVHVSPAEDGAHIVVADEGPGVPTEERTEIFEPFRQGDASSGVGIGLTVVARFAELHGGRAWVDEREGGGAAFHVLLPTHHADGEDVADRFRA